MSFPQHPYPHVPGRRIDDVEREMREQDESAATAQRNLLIAIAVCLVLTLLAWLRDLGAGVVLFGGATVVLLGVLAVITLVRRGLRKRLG